jgi:hypothetical protein
MLQILYAIKGASVFGLKVVVPSCSPLLIQAAGLIDETTVVPLTIVGAIGGASWYLNGRLTRIEDQLENLKADSLSSRQHHQQLCPLIGSQIPPVLPKNQNEDPPIHPR